MKSTLILALLCFFSVVFGQYQPNMPKNPPFELSGDYQKDFEMIEARLKLSLYQSDLARRQIDHYRHQSNVGLGIMFIGAALTTVLALTNPEEPVFIVGGVVFFVGSITSLTARKYLKATPPPNFDNP